MEKIIGWIKGNWGRLAGIGVGATAGYLYWYFVGCASGTCAITSSPLNSTAYGALMGFLGAGLFQKDLIAPNKNTKE